MSSQLIDAVEKAYKKSRLPVFRIGDTVDVACRIVEGEKERTQVFGGVVIARRGHGLNEMFTVRRIVNNEGVERTFMLHSPQVGDVAVRRSGKVRRAKLYYLRDRVGKRTKLRERRAAQTRAPKETETADSERELAAVGA
jgi:large subunit ribosomal protein L19